MMQTAIRQRRKTNGRTKIYEVWNNMTRRCLNPNNPRYMAYGGRGIKICNSWLTFNNFYDDMGDSYAEGLFLDRIDNDRNYEKSNCRWVSSLVSANNTQKVRRAKGYYKLGEKYCSQININGYPKYIGYFSTEEEARRRYLEEAKKKTDLLNKE